MHFQLGSQIASITSGSGPVKASFRSICCEFGNLVFLLFSRFCLPPTMVSMPFLKLSPSCLQVQLHPRSLITGFTHSLYIYTIFWPAEILCISQERAFINIKSCRKLFLKKKIIPVLQRLAFFNFKHSDQSLVFFLPVHRFSYLLKLFLHIHLRALLPVKAVLF